MHTNLIAKDPKAILSYSIPSYTAQEQHINRLDTPNLNPTKDIFPNKIALNEIYLPRVYILRQVRRALPHFPILSAVLSPTQSPPLMYF